MFSNKQNAISVFIVATWLGFVFWSTYSVFDGNTQIYAENGLMENMQAFVLVIACITFLTVAVFNKKAAKAILLFCFFLCYSFILREVDVEDFDVPYILKLIGSGTGRNAILLVGFVTICIYALSNGYSNFKKAAVEFIKTRAGILLVLGGVLLFAGDSFETRNTILHHVFFEEIFELSAYILILLSSLAVVDSFTKSKKVNSSEC